MTSPIRMESRAPSAPLCLYLFSVIVREGEGKSGRLEGFGSGRWLGGNGDQAQSAPGKDAVNAPQHGDRGLDHLQLDFGEVALLHHPRIQPPARDRGSVEIEN